MLFVQESDEHGTSLVLQHGGSLSIAVCCGEERGSCSRTTSVLLDKDDTKICVTGGSIFSKHRCRHYNFQVIQLLTAILYFRYREWEAPARSDNNILVRMSDRRRLSSPKWRKRRRHKNRTPRTKIESNHLSNVESYRASVNVFG